MSTRTRKRLIAAVVSAGLLLALFFAYQRLEAAWRVGQVRQLAAQMKGATPEKAKELRGQLWAAAKKLTREERREVFEEGGRNRLDSFFKASQAEKTAILDSIIKRDLQRQLEAREEAQARAKSQGNTKVAATAQSRPGGGPGGGGGGGGRGNWRNMSPEQRAQARRNRLDNTNPMDRGRRAEFASALRERRKQLGIPDRRGRRG